MVACKCGSDFASAATSRITIQSLGIVPDEYGGREEAWSNSSTVWANIEPMTGKEVYLSSQLQSRVDAKITIRYQSSLANTVTAGKSRVQFGTRIYNIRFVKNLDDDLKTEGKRFQQLFCTEGEAS